MWQNIESGFSLFWLIIVVWDQRHPFWQLTYIFSFHCCVGPFAHSSMFQWHNSTCIWFLLNIKTEYNNGNALQHWGNFVFGTKGVFVQWKLNIFFIWKLNIFRDLCFDLSMLGVTLSWFLFQCEAQLILPCKGRIFLYEFVTFSIIDS